MTGWTFQDVPVEQSAESILTADRLLNGVFVGSNGTVRVFSASRYAESGNEIGLFVHTPDRCWTEAGWKLEPLEPEFREIVVHGVPITFERRVFSYGSDRELVYFAGLVSGQSLPFRLDHNLTVGMKRSRYSTNDATGTVLRASDGLFWKRLWESFLSRRPLTGPKQFFRVSTPIQNNEPADGDGLLVNFLSGWLQPAEYGEELRHRPLNGSLPHLRR